MVSSSVIPMAIGIGTIHVEVTSGRFRTSRNDIDYFMPERVSDPVHTFRDYTGILIPITGVQNPNS